MYLFLGVGESVLSLVTSSKYCVSNGVITAGPNASGTKIMAEQFTA